MVVIGGGTVGCETAAYLAHEGSLSESKLFFMMSQKSESIDTIEGLLNTSSRNISIVDVGKIGASFDFGCGWPVIKDLGRLGVKQFSKAEILEISKGKVHIRYPERKTKEILTAELDCDTLVLAVGYEPDKELFETLQAQGIAVYNIGDSKEAGRIIDATEQAKVLADSI